MNARDDCRLATRRGCSSSTALVLLMVPGLALFYGGLVRTRAVLNTFMMSVAALAVVGVQWVLGGYSLAFGPGSRHRVSVMGGAGRSRRRAGAVQRDDSTPRLRGIPGDVRRHHRRADLGRDGRAHSLSRLHRCSRWSGRRSSTIRSRIGCGRPTAGCTSSARSTSRAAPSCTSAPARRRSSPRSCSAAPRFWTDDAAAAQRRVHAHGRRAALGRLARIQRRLGARRGRRRRARSREHARAPAPALLAWLTIDYHCAAVRRRPWAVRRARSSDSSRSRRPPAT